MATGRVPSVEGGIQPTIVDAKGDLIVATAADTVSRIAVGSNDQVLTADSSTSTGVKWATPAAGGMTLISETVASAISSLSFSSLGSYKQLILYWGGIRHSTTGSAFGIRFNNSSSSIYIGQGLGMSASSAAAQGDQQTDVQVATTIGAAYPFGEATNLAGLYADASGYLQLENYTSTTKAKNYLVSYGYYNNTSSKYISREFTGYFDSTSAITSIDIFRTAGSATFSNQSNSTIRLYGVS